MTVRRYNDISPGNQGTLDEFVVVRICGDRFYLPSYLYTGGNSVQLIDNSPDFVFRVAKFGAQLLG